MTKDERACKRKKHYSKDEAEHIAFVRNYYKRRHGRAYECPIGDHWHVTKQPAGQIDNNVEGRR